MSSSSNSVFSDSVSGEERYLTRPWQVYPGEPSTSSSSSKLTSEKIKTALDHVTCREPHFLIQFWSPVGRKRRRLTTLDQPFGLGLLSDEGLRIYRMQSEHSLCYVDEEHENEYSSPLARAYLQKLPEWSLDVTNYSARDYPLQVFASCCKIRGSLALPVIESSTGCCVGVLELVVSAKYTDYAYEVKKVQSALKAVKLETPPLFDSPSYVANRRKERELDNILQVLKASCDTLNLPLAQTWEVSPFSSFVAHEKKVERCCSSFNARCIGKVCMSTAFLPYHVKDLARWKFREACVDQHLERSRGVVGRVLSSRGSCFCGDVTKLGEDEYPLVHSARMSGLTSCFAIYLHSVEGHGGYVVEFFFPQHTTNLQNLVKTVKQQFVNASGIMNLGDLSFTEVIGQVSLDCNLESPALPKALLTGEGEVPLGLENLQLMDEGEENGVGAVETLTGLSIITYPESKEMKDVGNSQGRKRKGTSLEASPQQFKKPGANLAMRMCTLLKHVYEKLDISIRKRPRVEDGICVVGERKPLSTKVCFGINYAVYVLLGLRRWRLRSLIRDGGGAADHIHSVEPEIQTKAFGDLLAQQQHPFTSRLPEDPMANVLAIERTVTIKATCKYGVIKFRIPLGSGLSELEEQVAQRIKATIGSFCCKYIDEDNELILVASDADLHNLLASATTSVIRLIVHLTSPTIN